MLEKFVEKLDELIMESNELTEDEKVGIKQIVGTLVIQKVLDGDDTTNFHIPPIEDSGMRKKALWVIACAHAKPHNVVSKKTAKYLRRLAYSRNVALPTKPEYMTWAEAREWIKKIKQMPKPEKEIQLTQEQIKDIEKRLFQ